ncbi:MAG: hypothetical protein ACPHK8_05895 [Thermoplasmatota archaeon]
MRRTSSLLLGIVLLMLASVQAQSTVVEDPEGDVIVGSYGQTAPAVAPWQAVDMTAIIVDEDVTNFYWTVRIAGEPTNAGGCPDSGDLRTFFRYGEARYHVQQGYDLQCNPYGMFWETFAGDFSRRFIATLEVEANGPEITVTIPKELVIDEGGAPPMEGRSLTHIRGRSFNMASLGGPDLTDPFGGGEADLLVVNDDIPDAEADAGSYLIASGGIRYEGDLRLLSDRPFRASNGGEGVYLYELRIDNQGPARDVALTLGELPEQWRVATPTQFTLAAGSVTPFQVGIEMPFRHTHGGTDAATLRIADGEAWAELDVGISYLTVPQPAGHHPELFLHAAGPGGNAPLGGNGQFTMNTTEPERTRSVPAAFDDGPTGNVLRWHVCFEGDLKLGLNFTDNLGQYAMTLTDAPDGAHTFSGRLVHLGAGVPMQGCHPRFFGDRLQTDIAALEAVPIAVTGSSTNPSPVPVSVAGTLAPLVDLVPYQPGAFLYLEITMELSAMNVESLGSVGLFEGGKLELPLAEYREGNVIGAIGEERDADLSEADTDAEPEVEEAPWAVPVVGVLALGLLRRKENSG